MNKGGFLLLLLVVPHVLAAQVMVLDLYFDGSEVQLLNSTIMEGYAPSHRLVHERGLTAEVRGSDDILQRISFKDPRLVFVDSSKEGKLEGGLIVLTETDFSLVVPFDEEMDEILFYDKEGVRLSSVSTTMDESKPYGLIVGIVLIVVLSLGVWILRRRK